MKIKFVHNGQIVTIYGPEKDHIACVIQQSKNFYEPEMLQFINGLHPRGTIIDVGANIGNHSVYFGLFTDATKVISIEPYGVAAELLRRNIEANNLSRVVTQFDCALGSRNGVVGIRPGRDTNIGTTRVIKGVGIELKKLDDIARCEPVSIIKIDVEGYELEVLKGAREILQAQHPILFLEASTPRRKGILDEYLLQFGYHSGPKFNWTPTYLYTVT